MEMLLVALINRRREWLATGAQIATWPLHTNDEQATGNSQFTTTHPLAFRRRVVAHLEISRRQLTAVAGADAAAGREAGPDFAIIHHCAAPRRRNEERKEERDR